MQSQSATVSKTREGRTGPAWYVVHVRPTREQLVAHSMCEQLELEAYLPQVRQRRRDGLHISPFFPGYLFVNADLSATPVSSLNSMPGVVRVVQFGGVPQHIPDAVVDELRQRVDSINGHEGVLERSFEPGAKVRLERGPFRGLEGAFVGPPEPSFRVRVLVEFLGQLCETEVDAAALVPADTPGGLRRERRTRGGGRRVAVRQPAS